MVTDNWFLCTTISYHLSERCPNEKIFGDDLFDINGLPWLVFGRGTISAPQLFC